MIKIEGAYGIASDCKVRRCCNRYIAIDLEIRAEDANSLKEIMVKVIKMHEGSRLPTMGSSLYYTPT
jgi:hypothetical protein